MKSLRKEFQTINKVSEGEVEKTSTSTSKAGPTKQPVELSNPNTQPNPRASDRSDNQQPMAMDFCGPSLPPRFGQSAQSDHGSNPIQLDHHSKQLEQPERVCSSRAKKKQKNKKTSRQKETQGSGKILLTVFIFRGGTVLCSY